MPSQPVPGAIELLVLASVEAGCGSVPAISQRVGQSDASVREAVSRLAQNGLVEASGDSVALTADGRLASARVGGLLPRMRPGSRPAFDLVDVSRFVRTVWSASEGQRRTLTRRSARDQMLASNADRDAAVQQLSDAFAQGRLTSSELDERSGKALSARTYGELDVVLAGLGGLPAPPRRHPVRKALFWVAAVLASPWVLLGTLLLLFGVDRGDRIGGLFFLVLLLPGLVALGRWSWRRT